MTNTAFDNLLDALRDHGSKVIANGGGKAMAQCPAHDDRNPSLSITDGETRVLMHCFANCDNDDVMAKLGRTMGDLYDAPRVTYRYNGGRFVTRVVDTKKFFQTGNKNDTSLYRVERIGDAKTVYVCEGEEDVHAVEAVGGVAVCSPQGALSARKADWSPLAGREIRIIAHRDKAGHGYAAKVTELLGGVAESVTVVQAAVGKDASDHIAAGKTLNELVPIDLGTINGQVVGGGDGQPRLRRATDLKPSKPLTWLAKDRLPRAAISLLIGDEGIGKSLLWVWIAAAVTTGKPLPEFGIPEREPSHVAIVVTEDDWQTTVRPRLEVAGVDLAMVSVFCTEDDGSGTPVFPRDIDLLYEADPRPALVVLDAWVDTVTTRLAVKDPQQARQALHPFREVAIATDAAILLLCHTNRVDTANIRDKYGLTGELRKKVRMALYAQADEDGAMVVGPDKTNLTAAVKASRFAIEKVQVFEPTEDSDGTVPKLVYAGESDRTAREHLVDAHKAERGDAAATGDAVGWLAAFLGPGPQWSVDVHNAREREGISEKQLRSAKTKLNIESKRSGPNGYWYMALPQHEGQMPATPPPGPDGPCPWEWASDDLGRSEGTSGGPSPDALPDALTDTPPALSTSQDSQKALWNDTGRLGTPGRRGDTAPPCIHCGLPVAAGQRDATGRPAHLGCQQTGGGAVIRPAGPDRCPDCGYHVPTQGHRDPCIGGAGRADG